MVGGGGGGGGGGVQREERETSISLPLPLLVPPDSASLLQVPLLEALQMLCRDLCPLALSVKHSGRLLLNSLEVAACPLWKTSSASLSSGEGQGRGERGVCVCVGGGGGGGQIRGLAGRRGGSRGSREGNSDHPSAEPSCALFLTTSSPYSSCPHLSLFSSSCCSFS